MLHECNNEHVMAANRDVEPENHHGILSYLLGNMTSLLAVLPKTSRKSGAYELPR